MMIFSSNPGPNFTPSYNYLDTGEKLIIASSVTKDVYIRPCISLIMHNMQIYTFQAWFIYLYFGGQKSGFFNHNQWLKRFHVLKRKISGLCTSLQFISKIRRLIRIKLCRNTSIQMDLSKNNSFSTKKAINFKEGTSM